MTMCDLATLGKERMGCGESFLLEKERGRERREEDGRGQTIP